MPMQQSTMVPLGRQMPAFALPDVVSGRMIESDRLDASKPVLVLFICAHCPFTRRIGPAIRALARDYRDKVNLLAISANDPVQVPEDSPDGLKRLAFALELGTPFCYDEPQTTARAFGAECTPECFLFDTARALVYRGQIEGAGSAVDALLGGAAIETNQRPGLGCNIKWRTTTASLAGAAR